MTEDEVVGWYSQLNGHEFEQAPGVGDGFCPPSSRAMLSNVLCIHAQSLNHI